MSRDLSTTIDSRCSRTPKYVVAHFMVGNTFPYSPEDWAADINLACQAGLHGFALNVGKEDWQADRVADCFDAALKSTSNFKLFISFDMSSLPSRQANDVIRLHDYITKFARHPNYLKLKGKALVSTFSGENSTFGQSTVAHAWSYVKDVLRGTTPVCLVPSLFIDPRRYDEINALDGGFNWNGCWPCHLPRDSPPHEIHRPKLLSDEEHLRHLHGKMYMASVSPWFFTHYGPDSWNKNWLYRGDDWLFVRRWQQLIAMRDNVDIVQVISWNDYGESHYIGPIKGAQPNSEAWVNGFDHQAWLHLNSYFTAAFKTGRYPPITEDRVYLWARPHPKTAVAPDAVPKPDNWELTEDVFWAVVLAAAPASVALSSGGEQPRRFDVSAGLSMLQCPLVEMGGMRVQLVRSGSVVMDFQPEGFFFNPHPVTYNFNAFVAMYP